MHIALQRLVRAEFSGFSLRGRLSLARSRRALASLDADQLRDVGLSAAEAEKEASRPLWDAPAHWRL